MGVIYAIFFVAVLQFRFLSDEDDDVSEGVFEFCHSYLGLLKQLNGCSPIQRQSEHIKSILHVILNKMKFDRDFDFNHEVRSYVFCYLF